MARLSSSQTFESPRLLSGGGGGGGGPSSPTSVGQTYSRIFCVPSLLLIISGWALTLPVSATVFNGFGTPPCACRPHHPLHPQLAFCASDFALKVRFLRLAGEQLNSQAHYLQYWVHVKQVFRNSLNIPSLRPNRRLYLSMYGSRDNCGAGITVRHYNETQSIISGGVQLKKFYLVTGKLENGRLTLSICSWIAYWPNRKARRVLPTDELVATVVTVQQARYLRHGRYAKGCSRCKIEDTHFAPARNDTNQSSNKCSFDPSRDYFMCLASYAYCAHYSDPYSRTSGCAWHTASHDRYRRCATENLKLTAQREGIGG